MYNILHTASAPGLRDTLDPVRRRRTLRWGRPTAATAPARPRPTGAAGLATDASAGRQPTL